MKWDNTRKMPTYLHLPVKSSPPTLVGFEEVPVDG
jgi:hypothetical protein